MEAITDIIVEAQSAARAWECSPVLRGMYPSQDDYMRARVGAFIADLRGSATAQACAELNLGDITVLDASTSIQRKTQ
jgi:hypothetical protein